MDTTPLVDFAPTARLLLMAALLALLPLSWLWLRQRGSDSRGRLETEIDPSGGAIFFTGLKTSDFVADDFIL